MAATKRAEQKAATRAKIVDVAKRSFMANGYEGTTIRMLAQAMGMSTGAVFAHFTDKDEIYREIYGHYPVSPEEGRILKDRVGALTHALAAAAAAMKGGSISAVMDTKIHELLASAHMGVERIVEPAEMA